MDGYAIPLQIRGGLAYLDMHPPNNDEYDALPHVILTSDVDWNPTIIGNELNIEDWLDTLMEADDLPRPYDMATTCLMPRVTTEI